MRSVSVLVLFTLACGACGVTGGTSTVVPSVDVTDPGKADPTPTSRPREDPWVAFAATILEASRALQAAALGNPYDEKWQCADPKKDIRATDARVGTTFTSKGNPEYLLTTLQDITLTSPIDPAARTDAPSDSDEPTPRPAQKPRIVMRGNAFIFADARVRWFEITARNVSYSSSDGETQTLLKRLPNELRGAMSDLVTTLTSSCVLSFIDGADLAPLPIPQEKKESAIEMVEHNAAEVSHACEAAARASGPWDAKVGRMMSAYRAGEGLATLGAELRIEQGRLCIGRGTADTI